MLTEFDLMYMGRSYAKIPLMKQFLEKWGLTNKSCVLDAGFGFGAWIYALKQLNETVWGTEPDKDKYCLATSILLWYSDNINNDLIKMNPKTIEHLSEMFPQGNIFDGILCYHVIYYTTNWQITLETLAKLMSPGGVMYINIATSECFVHMAESGDPITKQMGNNAITQMLNKKHGKPFDTKDGIPIRKSQFETKLFALGLKVEWTGLDEMANHPGVIGYLVIKT